MSDWIKLRTNIFDDPRVSAICDATDRSEVEIVGALAMLWSMADTHTEDGFLPAITTRALNRKIGIEGFAEAVIAIGWLETADSGVRIPRFGEHNGKSAKTRASNAKRNAAFRKRDAGSVTEASRSHHGSVTEASPSTSTSTRVKLNPPTPQRGERVRREAFDPESVELPDPLDCDRFRDAWRKWIDHRREIRKRLTRKSVTEQLGKLADMGVDGAVSAIETAIANGWTGVVFPGSKSQPARASPADTGAAAAFEATRNVILKIPVQDTDRYRSAMASLDARARGALQAIGGARRIRDMTDQNRGLVFSQFRSAFEKYEAADQRIINLASAQRLAREQRPDGG